MVFKGFSVIAWFGQEPPWHLYREYIAPKIYGWNLPRSTAPDFDILESSGSGVVRGRFVDKYEDWKRYHFGGCESFEDLEQILLDTTGLNVLSADVRAGKVYFSSSLDRAHPIFVFRSSELIAASLSLDSLVEFLQSLNILVDLDLGYSKEFELYGRAFWAKSPFAGIATVPPMCHLEFSEIGVREIPNSYADEVLATTHREDFLFNKAHAEIGKNLSACGNSGGRNIYVSADCGWFSLISFSALLASGLGNRSTFVTERPLSDPKVGRLAELVEEYGIQLKSVGTSFAEGRALREVSRSQLLENLSDPRSVILTFNSLLHFLDICLEDVYLPPDYGTELGKLRSIFSAFFDLEDSIFMRIIAFGGLGENSESTKLLDSALFYCPFSSKYFLALAFMHWRDRIQGVPLFKKLARQLDIFNFLNDPRSLESDEAGDARLQALVALFHRGSDGAIPSLSRLDELQYFKYLKGI